MREVVIVDAVRTPIGKYKGALASVRPDDLGGIVIQAILQRNPSLHPSDIEEVVLGNANGAGEDNRNVARMASLLAGLPVHVAGTTINRLCGSGLDAITYAARGIAQGEGDVFIAGGTESMTRAPFVMAKPEIPFPRGDRTLHDTTIGWRFINEKLEAQFGVHSMPETAEHVAKEYGITREAQDRFAWKSQMKAKEARSRSIHREELVPVSIKTRTGEMMVEEDEHPRPQATLEALASLKPLFHGGTVTAGNASGVNDGAAALLLMSKEKAELLGIKPLAKYIGSAVAGVEPRLMGIGPIHAVQKLLARTGIPLESIGLVELNEAFAAQAIPCIQELKLREEIVNVNGGAIAYGHPLGASGARIVTSLLYEMKRRNVQYGLATMCIGVGQGIATILERIE